MTSSPPSGAPDPSFEPESSPQADAAERSAPLVSLRDVVRRHRDGATVVEALRGVSLDIVAAELLGVAGPSGAGKSTLLDIAVGWQIADEGVVERSFPAAGWAAIALVPQGIGLLPDLTAVENVRIAGGSTLLPLAAALEALDRVELAGLADRPVTQLSLGEQQRVAVARAVVVAPTLLVADEPTSHQDERRADLVVEALRACVGPRSAVVIASHDERVLAHVDRLVPISDGRLAASSTGASPTVGRNE